MADRIRIALMTHTIDGRAASGTALVARKCIEALLQEHDEFDITFVHFEKSDESIYHHGVRDIVIPALPGPLNRRFFREAWFFLTTKERFDIIHWFQPRLYPLFWLAPAKHIVVTVHGAGDTKKDGHFIWSRSMHNWTLRLFRRFVSAAIAGSDYSRKDILSAYHLQPEQVYVVNNGVEAAFSPPTRDRISAVKEKYHLPEHFFLGVARFAPSKNIIRTLRAYELFRKKHPDSTLHFVNIGAKGQEKPLVDAFIDETDAREYMHFVGYVEQEDLAAFYGAAHALVFPILNEGFGLPAVEAMATGTPTIISETAAPELTGDVAVSVDVLSVESIAAGMEKLAEDDLLRTRIIAAGIEKAKTLTWEASTEKVLAIYRRLLAR